MRRVCNAGLDEFALLLETGMLIDVFANQFFSAPDLFLEMSDQLLHACSHGCHADPGRDQNLVEVNKS